MSGLPSARESLPEMLQRAIDQTVAAERLEGWCPTGGDVDALAALLRDDVAFEDYLAAATQRHPADPVTPRQRYRRLLRRRRPYLIEGSTVLRNNFGVTQQEALAEVEFVATAGRIALWHRGLARHGGHDAQDVDFRAIHRHVFGDVYAWAGDYRVTELRRGPSVFARQSTVCAAMTEVEESARELAGVRGLDAATLGYRLARLYADYNQIHPFREGNGRTGTLVLHTVAASCGRRLDLTGITRDEWYSASRDSMPFRREVSAVSARPFVPLLVRALR